MTILNLSFGCQCQNRQLRYKTMTREEAKELLPIMQAFAEGKTLQYRVNNENNEWKDIDNPTFNDAPSEYRIKPELKYRPFKTMEECWSEMLKHQPFGWIRSNISDSLSLVEYVSDDIYFNGTFVSYEDAFECSEFIDGAPFGIKEE